MRRHFAPILAQKYDAGHGAFRTRWDIIDSGSAQPELLSWDHEVQDMLVGNIMTSEVITVAPTSSIGAAIELMREHGFRRLPVVEDGKLVGIVTDRDLRQATNSPLVLRERWYSEFLLEAIKVRSCMTADPITVQPTTPVAEAALRLREHKIGGLPVVDVDGGDRVVGMVTITDMLGCLIHLLTQAPAHDAAFER